MKQALVAACAAFLVSVIALPALASIGDSPVFALHLKDHTSKGSSLCTTWSPAGADPATNCADYTTAGITDQAYDLYLVVAGIDSTNVRNLAGISCGVEYNGNNGAGIDIFSWTVCADGQEYKNGPEGGEEWPASHGGNRITWSTCQDTYYSDGAGGLQENGIHAIAGAFYLFAYGADTFRITPNRNLLSGAELRVGNCAAAESPVDTTGACTGYVEIAGGSGFNPCAGVPVEPTTWGKIKRQYGN